MFITSLRLEEFTPGAWTVLAPLEWKCERWHFIVPAGFTTDLASIPRPLRAVLNVNGASRSPAVLHDWLYSTQPCTRAESDLLFRHALAARDVSAAVRFTYWAGVRAGGWLYWNRKTVRAPA